jgi:hypothetical protein
MTQAAKKQQVYEGAMHRRCSVYIPPQQPNSNIGEKEVACLPGDEAYPYDDTINRAEVSCVASYGHAVNTHCHRQFCLSDNVMNWT